MRSLGVRLPILAVTAWAGIGLSVWASISATARPSTSPPQRRLLSCPPHTSTSPSYLLPTAYSFPSYLPTAYAYEPVPLASTTYLTTGYTVRRGLFGRLRLVERPVVASYATRYLPTMYFSPGYSATSYATTSYAPTVLHAPRRGYRPSTHRRSTNMPRQSGNRPTPAREARIATRLPGTRRPSPLRPGLTRLRAQATGARL